MEAVKETKVDFNNTEIAFRNKSDKELEKSYWMFKMISSSSLIQIGTPLVKLSLNIGLPIQGVIRSTVYQQFCGGETIEGCTSAIENLGTQNVTTILDYSVEGEENEDSFNHTCEEILRTVAFAQKQPLISFCVFKPSGLGRFDLMAKIDAKQELSEEENEEFARIMERCDRICQACYESDIPVLIDAEHSWIQDTIDDMARLMMERYNRHRPIVYNTYQLYRHDKLASLKADFDYAKVQNFYLGAKLVRGAYMEIERTRAKEKDYPSPIQRTKEACDHDYNQAMLFCLDHLERIGCMAGAHNEDSSRFLVEEINRRNIPRNHPHVYFAQLLGMSDNLSFNLGVTGYNVAKYMPYGPVKAVMPYLFRRARENTSVGGQTGRELSLIIKEKERRKQQKKQHEPK